MRYDEETVCEYKFTYDQDENDETNIRIEDQSCPGVNVAAFGIVGVILATFLIGLILLLIFKCNIYLADRREFAKFQEEQDKQTKYLNENPFYKSPITTFKNPNSPDLAPPNVFELD